MTTPQPEPTSVWRLRAWVALSFALIVALYAVTLDKVPAVYVDEPWHAERALAWMTLGEFAHWSFPYGYGSVGDINPLMTDLHLIAVQAMGYNLFAVRLVSFGAFVATLWLWYLIVTPRLGRGAGLVFLWLYSLSLMVFFSAHVARFEAPIMLVLTAALFLGTNLERLLPIVPRFMLVGLLGSMALFIHAPGVIAPVVAAVMAVLLLGLNLRHAFLALVASAIGTLLGWAAYLLVMDWSTISWFFLGDFQKAVRVPTTLSERLLAYPSLWWQLGVRGNWLAGPLHEGDLIATGLLGWVLAALWLGLRNHHLAQVRAMLLFGAGALLTLMLLAAYGRASYHYLGFFTPWLAAMLAGAVAVTFSTRPLWRIAVAATLLFMMLRVGVYIGFTWRHNADDYAARLTASVPAGSAVLATIDNGFIFRPDYRFFAIDDLQIGDRAKGTLTAAQYLETYGIDYVVINTNDRLWLGRESNQPWGNGLLAELDSRGTRIAEIRDDYFFTGSPGFHGSPAGGVLFLLRDPAVSTKPITEVWRLGAQAAES